MSHRRQRTIIVVAAIALVAAVSAGYFLTGEKYEKHTDSMLDVFDTVITLVAYTKDEAEFDRYYDYAYDRLHQLHKLYDFYNSYDGINNIVTVNRNAGKAPVEVDEDVIGMLLFAKGLAESTGGRTNIAMGSVLRIWHEFREEGINDPENARIPDMSDLKEAARHTDIEKMVIDEEAGTVYLEDPMMSLDVGAVAKGYATELVAKELAEMGMSSGIISSGGNIRAIGKPMDGIRQRWGVGIQDPDKSVFLESDEDLLDVVYINDGAVASSGDYQRYYIVDDKIYHHIIDLETLMPADYYRAVTVLTDDAGLADFMSTALFLLPLEKSRELAADMGVEAYWVLPNGRKDATDGMLKSLRSMGASGADKK
ncbi:MAG: Thiamine biosynthesis lipoprotein ApbE precursor [Firmicutes bacterium ADurb.Bin153]|nr:MAG: Thiamine biosynthesis lipoprotein ApbE precursor [Firmicutes bacterium ADurb.Bin153]